MRSTAFRIALWGFHKLDRAILQRLSERRRMQVHQVAVLAKARLFPSFARRNYDVDALRAEPPLPRAVSPEPPGWLLAETAALRREVDESLPRGPIPASPWHLRHPGRFRPGRVYEEILPLWPSNPTHVLIVPWLKRGGADLVAILHARLLCSVPGNRVLVVGTEPEPSTWAGKLPGTCAFLDLGPRFRTLQDAECIAILTRLLLQEPPAAIHVFASRVAWGMVAAHGRALAARSRLFASSFSDARDADGEQHSYARTYLPAAWPHLSSVFSDNDNHPSELVARYGYPRDLFKLVRVPTEAVTDGPRAEYGRPDILWAGRLDSEKRPDVLADVAASLPHLRFHVHGSTVLKSDPKAIRRLRASPNVIMAGPYDGFATLPEGGWGAFLHTSAWDGLPNVLLEAGIRGIPVVAPRVGGIGELVDEGTGWLVRGPGSEDYAREISACVSDATGAAARSKAMRERILLRHSDEAFARTLMDVPGYASSKPLDGTALAAE